jgi:hypothetical protein
MGKSAPVRIVQPNGWRISCGDLSACAQSDVSFETEAPAGCMRLLGLSGAISTGADAAVRA